jgi:L-glyceraldehyde reductase
MTQAVNQVEAHPLLPQDDLVKYCKEKNIHITAYSPLGSNCKRTLTTNREADWGIIVVCNKAQLTEHPVIQDVAKSLNATAAQVLIAWGVYRGYSVIPKSTHEERIISNFKQIHFTQEDYEKVSAFGRENYLR